MALRSLARKIMPVAATLRRQPPSRSLHHVEDRVVPRHHQTLVANRIDMKLKRGEPMQAASSNISNVREEGGD
uniref:Uncharacterized protein n=1 Tax=Leersia perrieri TaxID=77586 RepID=A0A0D9WVA8_9ORYZ